MNATTHKKGFTIIEVVLVLAIAGLIFLMVFVALPALRASQRDGARKNDVGSVSSAVNSYSSNTRGTLPTSSSQLGSFNATTGKWDGYLNAVSGSTTGVNLVGSDKLPVTTGGSDGVITIYNGGRCGTIDGKTITVSKGSARQYALVTKLEAGGGAVFCQDS